MLRWGLAIVVLAGCLQGPTGDEQGAPEDPVAQDLRLERIWTGLDSPLLVTHNGTSTFVVEQCGRVLVEQGDGLVEWLDVSGLIACGGERGLLGLAFPPDHDQNGRFYIAYTDTAGNSVLERRTTRDGRPTAEARSLLEVMQPAANHNGGHILFGPDGMLYYGLGDGGGAGDTFQNGQDRNTLLGTILRLDVSGDTYASPPDNPFVADPAGRDEVWSYGLRNPWRFSFDGEGAMWIGDVGQDCWEEIDHEPAGAGGRNYGWPRFEGDHLYTVPSGVACVEPRGDAPGFTFPVAEIRNGEHCSITGGHVDVATPELAGAYLFGDYCSGTIWTIRAGEVALLVETDLRISSFGTDHAGRSYVVDHGGSVHRFES